MGFDYTVSKDDLGLTYIFLEQAKKQAGFDGSKKINWQNVMSVFDEIQKEEQAEGQKLFRGGTDKTRAGWGKSYAIYAGDKISLSDAQMNKIYGAMGLVLSKITPSQPETPEPPAAAQSDQIPKKDENPPSAQTLPAKGADLSEAYRPLDREFLVPHKQFADKTVLQKDGTSYTYDEKGYISEVHDSNGKVTCWMFRLYDGTVDWYITNEYDANGTITRDICRTPDGAVGTYKDYEYDADGTMTRGIFRNPDGTVDYYWDYEYDDDGNKTREIYRNSDGTVKRY